MDRASLSLAIAFGLVLVRLVASLWKESRAHVVAGEKMRLFFRSCQVAHVKPLFWLVFVLGQQYCPVS